MQNYKNVFAISLLSFTSMVMVSCTLTFTVAKLYSEPRLGEGQTAYFHATPTQVKDVSAVAQADVRKIDGLTPADIYQTKEHFLDGSVNTRRDRTSTLFEILPGKHTVEIGSSSLSYSPSGKLGVVGSWQKGFSEALSVAFEAKAGHIYSPEITVDQKNGTFSAYVLDITDMNFRLKESTLNSIKASYPRATP